MDGAEWKRSVLSGGVLGNDVTFIIAELHMHTVEIICRNVPWDLVLFLVIPTSCGCNLFPEGMYGQVMER